jgi:hypothetical protein
MSIFPKRTIPGKSVTIHLNFNTSFLTDEHIFPYLRIGVEDPTGRITPLLEDHLLALPDPDPKETVFQNSKPKSLRRSFPLLILADKLDGGMPREVLETIVQEIESGRHFFSSFKVPDDAHLGKYRLITDIYTEGALRHSKTAEDDFFWVEHLELESVARKNSRFLAKVKNPSGEPVPVKIVECLFKAGKLSTQSRELELPAEVSTEITVKSEKAFLLYNEERETIHLLDPRSPFVLRNQRMLCLQKDKAAGQTIVVLARDGDKAYELSGAKKKIWDMASGLNTKKEVLQAADVRSYNEMLENGLISEQWIGEKDR